MTDKEFVEGCREIAREFVRQVTIESGSAQGTGKTTRATNAMALFLGDVIAPLLIEDAENETLRIHDTEAQ